MTHDGFRKQLWCDVYTHTVKSNSGTAAKMVAYDAVADYDEMFPKENDSDYYHGARRGDT